MVPSSRFGQFMALSLLLFSPTNANSLVEKTSFGNKDWISSDGSLPGWQASGQNYLPEIMSDRILLTPPYAGHKRGAIWANDPVTQSEWTAEWEFRTNGEDRPGGDVQLWYVKDGKANIGTYDIYHAPRFDGLAIVVDSSQGRGMVRGFLNDGTIDFRNHGGVDSLAFGHCEYGYRNLGILSRITIKHTASSFKVLVDGRSCFHTDKVTLPTGNVFGITASTTDNPDSFEIFKFLLSYLSPGSANHVRLENHQAQQNQQGHQGHQAHQAPADNLRAQPAGVSEFQTQIKEMQGHLHTLNGATERLLSELASLSRKFDESHQHLIHNSANRDQISSVDQRIMKLERMIEHVQKEIDSKDYRSSFEKLEENLRHHHSGLTEILHYSSHQILSSAPRMGFFIFLIIASQVLLAGAYVFYKRRRANMPKKFL